jgi:hypothetical protein
VTKYVQDLEQRQGNLVRNQLFEILWEGLVQLWVTFPRTAILGLS